MMNDVNIAPGFVSDGLLLEKYRQTGDKQHLAKVFCRYTHLVFAVCMNHLKNEHAAKDATQDIFLKITGPLLKTDVQNFSSYLFITAKHHCTAILKSKKNYLIADFNENIADSQLDMELIIKNEALYDKMKTCIRQLSPDQHLAITMFYFDNKSYNLISNETGKEWRMVRSLIQNGRKNLKNCLQPAN